MDELQSILNNLYLSVSEYHASGNTPIRQLKRSNDGVYSVLPAGVIWYKAPLTFAKLAKFDWHLDTNIYHVERLRLTGVENNALTFDNYDKRWVFDHSATYAWLSVRSGGYLLDCWEIDVRHIISNFQTRCIQIQARSYKKLDIIRQPVRILEFNSDLFLQVPIQNNKTQTFNLGIAPNKEIIAWMHKDFHNPFLFMNQYPPISIQTN